MDTNVFKAIAHDDDAFKIYLDTHGADITMDHLLEMNNRLTTQLARYGDEREDWFKKANALMAVVKNRMDQVKRYEQDGIQEWKDLVEDLMGFISEQANFTLKIAEAKGDIDKVYDWIDAVEWA